METESLITLAVALIALVGTLYSARRVKQISEKPDIVGQAGQVSGLAVVQMNKMAERADDLQGKLDQAEEKLEEVETNMVQFEYKMSMMLRRVRALEAEVIRLGGDPALVFPALDLFDA